LPVGIHQASLSEIWSRLGALSPHREQIYNRLEKIYRLATATGHLGRFIVFGSFVTDEPAPNDIDVFLVFDESFNPAKCNAEVLLLLDHAAADTHFGASVFWLRRPAAFGGEQSSIDFWKTRRDGGLRGIIEVIGE
jgi:hypothetical protein